MQWRGAIFSTVSILAMSACALDGDRDATDDHDTSEVAQDLSANPCTAVTLTLPVKTFLGNVGTAIDLNATATCPPGQTPEFQYWAKDSGAPNWTTQAGYFTGTSTFVPLASGSLCITVVARATGAPENYQTRASAHCGTVLP
jgi:hypothetical protein